MCGLILAPLVLVIVFTTSPPGSHRTTSAYQVLGSALYVVLCSLFAFGLGAILRSTAGAMAAAYGLLFLVPQLAKALPSSWYAEVVRWLPGGDVVIAITGTQNVNLSAHLFSAWGEFAVFGAYTVAALVAGAVLFRSRDA